MAVKKINARGWTFEISDGLATPTWTEIGGITSFTIGRSSAEADTTDFDSDGTEEHEKMQRGRTITLEGFFLEDPDNGDRNPGQEQMETLADAVGGESLQDFRMTSPGGTVYTQQVSAELADVGGGNNDKTSWGVALKRSGATTVA